MWPPCGPQFVSSDEVVRGWHCRWPSKSNMVELLQPAYCFTVLMLYCPSDMCLLHCTDAVLSQWHVSAILYWCCIVPASLYWCCIVPVTCVRFTVLMLYCPRAMCPLHCTDAVLSQGHVSASLYWCCIVPVTCVCFTVLMLYCPSDSVCFTVLMLYCPSDSVCFTVLMLYCPSDSVCFTVLMLYCPSDSVCYMFTSGGTGGRRHRANRKGRSYALFRYGDSISTVDSLHGVDLKPLQTVLFFIFYSLLLLAEFVFANYTLNDPSLQQHDWSKQMWSERKWNAPVHPDVSWSAISL